ncbi:tellurite resistance TerB family protein [Marinobacter persicus]|uniref:Tellurite resistance protein B-like protein n=1 Tax=Marinobacter persicus TaxID=930118 RepID=A0A2S6G732_9GAMM|nr:TerB family tellurite resistance protein [Marinobacter persicus]PPK51929.1 putative tellurite resistance protein B-like protein [Marinobacter persicus]PPK54965.1 putative tellurite resistance protein B-like protein [Marinobacter persicus]PPK58326.1 putative tellurite resistance protein B-like protein [Marinobacter persicus]
MIERLKQLFAAPEEEPVEPDAHQLAVAATALMVQLSRVDNNEDERELEVIVDCAVKAHQITREEARDILDDALNHAEDATSLYEFTGRINEYLDQVQKQALLTSIWRVALADGRIDKYEEHLIRRMADLLHLNHREYMQARHQAEDAAD